MGTIWKDLLTFLKELIRSWFFWVAIAIDILAIVAQIAVRDFQLPIIFYIVIFLSGFLWASFQLYRNMVKQLPSYPAEPEPFEILPISFEVSLGQSIPNITIWLYVCNHQRREIILNLLEVTSINLSGGPSLTNITNSRDIQIQKLSSRQLMCRRTLNEAEVRSIRDSQTKEHLNASFFVFARARLGRKQFSHETAQLSTSGRITGL
jgi:hypothetical protein